MNVAYVYKAVINDEPQLWVGGRPTVTPQGDGHLFKLDIMDELSDRSLCGLAMSDIAGKDRLKTFKKDRPAHMSICRDCQEEWKKDPEGPFSKWVKAAGVE